MLLFMKIVVSVLVIGSTAIALFLLWVPPRYWSPVQPTEITHGHDNTHVRLVAPTGEDASQSVTTHDSNVHIGTDNTEK